MINLLEKFLNCYSTFIKRLNYGLTNQKYELLYNTFLLLRNNISEPVYVQYFYNNLQCSGNIRLSTPTVTNRVISWAYDADNFLDSNFVWAETSITNPKTYSITTTPRSGYNFIFISVPQDLNVNIYDSINNLLFNSSIAGSYQFTFVGTITTSKGQLNNVYVKNNVYNTINPVTFYIKLY